MELVPGVDRYPHDVGPALPREGGTDCCVTAHAHTDVMAHNMPTHPNWDEGHQRILNEYEVPARHLQIDPRAPIPVRARIVWEDDGEEWIDTHAESWFRNTVLVLVSDRRAWIKGAWLDASDIRRR